MKKWHLVINIATCVDCNCCFLSNKDEHVGNDFPGYAVPQPRHGHRWINIMRKERGQCPMIDVAYLPVLCMHCDEAPCISKAKNGAVYKRDDGIVIIDPDKAKGQKGIVDACPYKAVWWNEEYQVPQKWIFDAHLLDAGWNEPRCVQSCATGSMQSYYMEDSEFASMVESEKLEVLYPEYNTKPRVYYKNLYRYFSSFIGGSVAVESEGITDCAEGAQVTLLKDATQIGAAETDNFGDFKFDRLEENSGIYTLEIDLAGFEKKSLEIELNESQYVGTILFSKE